MTYTDLLSFERFDQTELVDRVPCHDPAYCCRRHDLFRKVHDHVALFEVNLGIGTAIASDPMLQPADPDDFPRRRTPPSSRSKILLSLGPPLALRSQAMQRSRPSPSGSPTRPR